jgi:fructokinase
MAAGPALRARWGVSGDTLPPDHPAWRFQAHYLAQALVQYILTLSPQKIILGGGVMQQAHLFPMVRQQVQALLNGYVQHPMLLDRPDHYIIPPALGDKAGVLGALALAQEAAPGG